MTAQQSSPLSVTAHAVQKGGLPSPDFATHTHLLSATASPVSSVSSPLQHASLTSQSPSSTSRHSPSQSSSPPTFLPALTAASPSISPSSSLASTPASSAAAAAATSLSVWGLLSHDKASDRFAQCTDYVEDVHAFLDTATSTGDALQTDATWAQFLGQLGEAMGWMGDIADRAPMVGVVFALLSFVGKKLAATSATAAGYHELSEASELPTSC